MKISIRNVFLFAFLLLVGAICGYCFRFELGWDFANYHYYNPWAFLNGRVGYDIAPASINTYFNPLIDIPFYYMVKYLNDYPGIVSALQGMYFGVLLFLIFKIAELFFTGKYRYLCIFLSLMVCSTGFAVFSQVSTTTNEMQIAVLILWAFYILLKIFSGNLEKNRYSFLLSGLLLGMAAGFKLTAVIYCISAFITLLCFRKNMCRPGLMIFMFCLGGAVGFLLINGFWMWKLWALFQNPLFPFANGIFKSEYFDDFNYSDKRFLPQTPAEWLFYPFMWALHMSGQTVAEHLFIDFRFAIGYVILVLYGGWRLCGKTLDIKSLFLFVYLFSSYVVWLCFFSIMRYALVMEALLAIVIVKFVCDVYPKELKWQVLYFPFVAVLLFVLLTSPEHMYLNYREGSKVVEMESVSVAEDHLILLYGFPTAGVIPRILSPDSKVRVIGMKQANVSYMKGSDFTERGKFRKLRDKLIAEYQGKIIIIARDWGNCFYPIDFDRDEFFKGFSCRKLNTNLDEHLYICE